MEPADVYSLRPLAAEIVISTERKALLIGLGRRPADECFIGKFLHALSMPATAAEVMTHLLRHYKTDRNYVHKRIAFGAQPLIG